MDENGRKEESSGEVPENNSSAPASSQIDDSMSPGDASQLEMLIAMGFDEPRVRKALLKFPSEDDPACERKMEWILEGGNDEEEDELLSAMMGQEDDDSSPTGANQVENPVPSPDANSGSADSKTAPSSTDKDANDANASKEPKKKVREVPQALQQLFGILEKGNVAYASTEALTQSFGWKASHTSVQHDVHELSRVLMDVVERSLRGTPKSTLVRSLFHGTQCHQIKCLQCGMVKERSEEFGDLTLAIPRGAEYEAHVAALDSSPKHGKNTRAANKAQAKANDAPGTSLEACLAHYFGLEYLNGKNQYECDACAMRTDAEIGMRMKHLPRVLCLSLARMEYNYTTGQRVKNTGKVSFPPSIDLSPYLSERPANGTSNVEAVTDSSTIYDLYSVIVHKGQTATSGHYTAYVKDLFDLSHGNAGDLNADDSDDEEGSNKKDDSNTKSKKKKKASHVEGGANWARLEALSDAQRLAGVSPDSPLPAELLHENSVWYNFDDTRVTRVSARSLPKVFSSSECAYMFFYRQRESVPTAELLEANISAHPPQLDTYLESFNKELLDAREAYEKEVNEVTLELVTPSHLCSIIPTAFKPHIINKNVPFGPPTFRWIEDEIKNGRLKLETSAPQLTPVALKFDQRRSMSDLMDELTSILNKSGEDSLGLPSESTLLMSLARTHHEKVVLERSFSIQRHPDSGIWTVKREEKEVMPPSNSLSELVASADSETLAKSTVKSLTFAKSQRIVFWDGAHFPIQALLQTEAAPPATPTSSLILGPQEQLPFYIQAPYSTARVRLYHAEKLSLPLSESSLAAQATDSDTIVTSASETLRQLYDDSTNELEIMATWNDVCEGNISVEAINTPNPYGPASFVTTLALQVPASLPLSRVLDLCKRSLLVQSLVGPVDSPIKILQPNLGSDGTQGLAVGAFGIVSTLSDLEKDVEPIKLQRWNQRMEAEQGTSTPAEPTNAEATSTAIIIDDTCGVILALDVNPGSPLVDDSYMLEVVAAIEGASPSNEQAYDETEEETEEEGSTTAADGSKAKNGNKKKKRTVDFYVILSLKMPKSAFYIRKESDKAESEESTALSTRLALNAPLPDEGKAASPFTEASQYQPRYIMRSVPEDETLRDLVKRVYAVSGLAQPPRLPMHSRLYSTDAFEQRDRIFDNFAVTIKQAQISSYSTLWLEEGEEPRPGLLQLSTKLFRLAPNKLAVDVTENPLLRPVPTLRANLLFLPLPLSSFFNTAPVVIPPPSSDVGAGDGLPPPPPPPPLPPTATAFLLEVTQQSTLSELKDALAVHIEDHVRELWRNELKKRRESGTLHYSVPEFPALNFFYEFFPFDFFLANTSEEKRKSMNLWIDDQIMVDDADSSTSLPLRSWRLNSWQRCNIAVLLTQKLPKHPIECFELTSLSENGLSFAMPSSSVELSMTTPPTLTPEDSRKNSSLFTFIRGRHSEVPIIDAPAEDSSEKKTVSKVPSLIDSGQYGDLSMLWVTAPTATSTKPPAGKAKGKGKSPANKEPGAGHVPHQAPAIRHAHLATHALVDLDALVLAFERGIVPASDNYSSQSGASALVPAIPPEWLLLARVGMMPHHHGMPLPKWQLIWKPSAFVQAEEAFQATETPAVADGEASKDAPKDTPAEKPKVIPTDEYGLGADDSAFANRNYVLMKHLQDKKVPGCEMTPTGFVLPSAAKKVKLLHGDTLVYADARTWAKNGLHEDVFWDEQRRRGLGSAEEAFMSDLEKALLESANMATRSRFREEALTIDVDF